MKTLSQMNSCGAQQADAAYLSRSSAASFTRLDDPNLLMWGSGSECVGPTLHISAENSQTSKPRSRWWKAWTLLTAPLSIFWIGRAVSSAKSKKQPDRPQADDLTRMIDWH